MSSILEISVLVLLYAALCAVADGFHPLFASKQPARGGPEHVCLTKECLEDAISLLSNIDRSTDPCDDFYSFACGRFLRQNDLNSRDRVGTVPNIQDEVAEQMRQLLEQPIRDSDSRTAKITKKLFQTCKNMKNHSESFVQPMSSLFSKVGGWPVVEGDNWNEAAFDWRKVVYKLKEAGTLEQNPFIVIDLTDDSLYTIELMAPTLDTLLKQHLAGLDYYDESLKAAKEFGANQNEAEDQMRKVFEFQRALNTSLSMNSEPTLISIEEFSKEFPGINLLEYINDLILDPLNKLDDYETVLVDSSRVKSILNLLFNTDNRTLANFIFLESLHTVKLYTFMDNSIQTTSEGEILCDCFTVINDIAGRDNVFSILAHVAINSEYVRNYVKEYPNKELDELVQNVREALYGLLSRADWMDEVSREITLEKAKAMTFTLAYPYQLVDEAELDLLFGDVDINEATFLENMIKIHKFGFDVEYNGQIEPYYPIDWLRYAASTLVNALYYRDFNTVFIAAAILHPSFFESNRLRYMNYGKIGAIIGHEIMHGFDKGGRQYKDGKWTKWWDEKTIKKFDSKAKCLIEEYNNYTEPMTEQAVDGDMTLGENIADNVGVRAAYWAYRAWSERQGAPEPRLPGLEWLSPRQMFWLAAAQEWCSKSSKSDMENALYGEHAPDQFRVIGPFSNSEEFAEDFKCDSTARMNPRNKCYFP